jgi:hypothetical protein
MNEYKLVNWREGMDIRFTHFLQLENYFIERLCDQQVIRLNKNSYGLLPIRGASYNPTEFDINERITGQVEIKLRRCNALTQGGFRIAYKPERSTYMLYTHTFAEKREEIGTNPGYWDVILSINPFQRKPSGVPDAETIPPLHPDATECYSLSIAAQGKINYDELGLFHLIIGRIRKNGERYEVDANYIPPCTSMSSHTDLIKYYEDFGVYLNDIEKTSEKIIFKIRNRTQNTPLAYHIKCICEEITRYIAGIYFIYRNEGRDMSPVYIVNYIATLAHVCRIGLDFISKTEKEEVLKYFYEWSDVTPGSFEDLLASTLGIMYEHDNIRTIMLQMESFLRIMSELWHKMSALEYIGQHKENIIVSERMHQTETVKVKNGWTILD